MNAARSLSESSTYVSDSSTISNDTNYKTSCRSSDTASEPRASRPQNFYGGKVINNRRKCLWDCGTYLLPQDMDHHVNHECAMRDHVNNFEREYGQRDLVAIRHPKGRPSVRNPEEAFLDEKKQIREFVESQKQTRLPFLDEYFKKKFGTSWTE